MHRAAPRALRTVPSAMLVWATLCVPGMNPARALDGGTPRVSTVNGWVAFEVITQGDDPSGRQAQAPAASPNRPGILADPSLRHP
jgi:hypothetical protein